MPVTQDKAWNNFWKRDQSKRFGKVSWSKKRILQLLEPYAVAGKKALDAGCGSGFFSSYFCDQAMQTVSLDYSEDALKLTRQAVADRSTLVKVDMLNDDLLEVVGDKFDLIFSDGLFEHFSCDEQDVIISNLTAVLADDGVIVTFVPNRWSPWELIRPFFMPGIEETPFVISELIDLNQRNGLRVVSSGGINVLPFMLSPERLMGREFGMLLYSMGKQ